VKSPQKQTVTVVIPCFNEAKNIAACLQALGEQTIAPFEVLVVDNNCTDETAKIARQFSFVTVIHEKEQGLIPARNAGFAAAKGTILARIDADSRVHEDWIETILYTFMTYPRAQAVSGTGFFYDAYFKRFSKACRNLLAVWLNALMLGHHMLWGSNMAIRANAWRKIQPKTCTNKNMLEDMDIAIHTHNAFGSGSTKYISYLRADISLRRATAGAKNNFRYLNMWPSTLFKHKKPLFFLSWLAMLTIFLWAPFLHFIVRAYDPEKDKLQLSTSHWQKHKKFERGNP
jgi:glycosyltransferase involved in cell wall biosynthesis